MGYSACSLVFANGRVKSNVDLKGFMQQLGMELKPKEAKK
jgi:hypothetical protein